MKISGSKFQGSFLYNSGVRKISSQLKQVSGGRILDIATGDGDFIKMLLNALKDFESVIGVDISKDQLQVAKDRFQNDRIKFYEMNAEQLKFPDEFFDTVCISHSLHHMPNIPLVLGEMKRVLKPDGYFIAQESYCDGEQTEAQKTDILVHHLDAEIDSLLGIYHRKTFTQKEIKSIFGQIDLKSSKIFDCSRYVKCLFCEEWEKCEDPLDEDMVNATLKEVDECLARLQKHRNVGSFETHAEKIRERTKKYGSAAPSFLLLVGKK